MTTIKIQEPERELKEGIFTLFLKYSVLFVVSYFAGILLFMFRRTPVRSVSDRMDTFMENPEFYSYIIIIGVFIFYTKRLYDKFKLGLITEFYFDEKDNLCKLTLLNTFNGNKKEVEFQNDELYLTANNKDNILFGKQRILTFYKKETSGHKNIVTILNIELTAWVRHPEITKILNNLKIDESDFKNN